MQLMIRGLGATRSGTPSPVGHMGSADGLSSFVYLPLPEAVAADYYGRTVEELTNDENSCAFNGQRMWGHGAITAGAAGLFVFGGLGFLSGWLLARR